MKRSLGVIASGAALAAVAWLVAPLGAPSVEAVETAPAAAIGEFTLRDHHGQPHTPAAHKSGELVVVAFLGIECPLVRQYLPRLDKLAAEYASRGVTFIGIDSNRQDSLEEIAQFVVQQKLTIPVLKDPDHTVADQFAAQRTPEVFVIDHQRRVRYRGRIDDQYGVGFQRPAATRDDLRLALDDLLAGREVTTPATEAAALGACRARRHAARSLTPSILRRFWRLVASSVIVPEKWRPFR